MISGEIDWRIGPLHYVIVGIESALKAIQEEVHKDEGFDGLWGREYADTLLGLGFVAAQTYALGAWTDLNKVRKRDGRTALEKHDCYASDPITVKAGVTRIELINATANYFKHHDQWPDSLTKKTPDNLAKKKPDNLAEKTSELLGRVGIITQRPHLPCVEATRLLCGESWDMIVLHQIVREWRAHIFSVLRETEERPRLSR